MTKNTPQNALDIKQAFTHKRRFWMRETEKFLDFACKDRPPEFRIEMQQRLGVLYDMHTEIANAPLLHTLQSAAEVGMAMAQMSATEGPGLEVMVDTDIAEDN